MISLLVIAVLDIVSPPSSSFLSFLFPPFPLLPSRLPPVPSPPPLPTQLYYTPDHLHTYIGLDCEDTVSPATHDGTKPDNIVKILAPYVPGTWPCLLNKH